MDAIPPPTSMPTVSLAGPVPGQVADLVSLLSDLHYVERLAGLVAVPPPAGADDDGEVTRRAIWEAAVIGYRRCVNQGKGHLTQRRSRLVIGQAVAQLNDCLRRAHEQFIGHADRHVAQRVNDLQQVLVLAMLASPPAPPAVEGIGWVAANYVGPTEADADLLRRLCAAVSDHLGRDLETVIAALREHCTSRLQWCYDNATPRVEERPANDGTS